MTQHGRGAFTSPGKNQLEQILEADREALLFGTYLVEKINLFGWSLVFD